MSTASKCPSLVLRPSPHRALLAVWLSLVLSSCATTHVFHDYPYAQVWYAALNVAQAYQLPKSGYLRAQEAEGTIELVCYTDNFWNDLLAWLSFGALAQKSSTLTIEVQSEKDQEVAVTVKLQGDLICFYCDTLAPLDRQKQQQLIWQQIQHCLEQQNFAARCPPDLMYRLPDRSERVLFRSADWLPTCPAQPQSAPAESQSAPAESQSAPAGPQSAPAGPQSAPAGPQSAPAGPQSAPAGPQSAPAGPQSAPAGPQPAPAGSRKGASVLR